MITVALLLGWLLTRFIEQPAHRGLMNLYDHVIAAPRAPSRPAQLAVSAASQRDR
jgi:peptidoglycan/LPS O-acetylase OafA/YrhL